MPDGMTMSVAIHAPSLERGEAALIHVCRHFAEMQLACWYRYVLTHEAGGDADALPWPADRTTVAYIAATPAVTLEGLRAKALAYSVWNAEAFDDPEDERDGATPLLASLLRDLARVERDAIVARLTQEHGPLPDTYTANGMWIGAKVAA